MKRLFEQFEKLPEQQKKMIVIGLGVIGIIWVFCITFLITYSAQQKKIVHPSTSVVLGTAPATTNANTSSYYSSVTTTTAPQTTEQSDNPLGSTDPYTLFGGNNVTTSAEYEKPSWAEQSQADVSNSVENEEAKNNKPTTKTEIVNTYVKAVNDLKKCENFTLVKVDESKTTVDKVTAGLDSIVQKYVDANTDDTPITYKFVNGNDASTGSSPNAIIEPVNKSCILDPSKVVSADCIITPKNEYKITIVLAEDKQTLSSPASVYQSCTDVITLESLNLDSSIKIDTLEVTYSKAVITATIDTKGRITSMEHTVTVSDAHATGKVILVNAELSMHGENKAKYTITY